MQKIKTINYSKLMARIFKLFSNEELKKITDSSKGFSYEL